MATIRKYNKTFDLSHEDENGNQTYDDLGIEFWCLRKGKEWIESEGRTLEFHYENVRKIIWPELDVHRWHLLCTKEIVNHKVTVLMGAGSTGKTHSAAWIALVTYWTRPSETCVLVASTHLAGLKKRVWAEIGMLWEQGVSRFPKLAGHLLESAIAITTDNIDDCDPGERKMRDMRCGIFGVACITGGKFVGLSKFVGIKQKYMMLVADEACFPAGTLVDTPLGHRQIEDMMPGDLVYSALGVSKVKRTDKFNSDSLVRIKTKTGKEIVCTALHPFLTQFGWKKSFELGQGDYMLSTYEAMQIMRGSFPANNQGQALPEMLHEIGSISLQAVQATIPKAFSNSEKEFLQSVLQFEMGSPSAGISSKVLHQKKNGQNSKVSKEVIQEISGTVCCVSSEIVRWDGALHGFTERRTEESSEFPHEQAPEEAGAPTKTTRREWDWSNKSGKVPDEDFPGSHKQLSHQDRNEERKWIPESLQGGFGISQIESLCGSGREFSHLEGPQGARHQENEFSNGDWVDSVEVLEQEDFERFGGSDSGVEVYNLEIEGHPSFSVNGFLSHNSMMGETFLSAFSNLNKNENFQAIVMGNPNDPLDPLGRAAEPKEGWTDDYMEPTKTKVWDTRFMNGRCVNLIGLDSPNFDFPADKPTRYKYLISHEKINDTLSFFPKDSMEYYSQCVGSMKIGTIARRVLSRAMAKEYHAQEQAIWRDENRTRIYFVDSSYGGDRCVAGWGEFGFDVDGKQILSLDTPKIIPILIGKGVEPEDQIARFVKLDCEQEMIPPENMGHDATGRGSLGTSLAREWSAMTNPIDAGGRPTKRPVSLEITIVDPDTGQKRPKRCDEHYDRLVSEFWFSVRYCVESGQMRNLGDESLEELCARKWDRIRGDKYAVEVKSGTPNKPGMKERTGKSPDIGDWVAGIVEMARRKGFIISKLGNPEKSKSSSDDWFKTQAAKLEKFRQSRQLQAA